MNRLEQIIEASKANLEKKDDEILHVYDRHAGFIEGAEWADNTMIEKACDWWIEELTYPSMTQEEQRWCKCKVNAFRKAMEGGNNENT